MEKFAGFAVVLVLVLALVVGAGAGLAWGVYRVWSSPAVVDQIVRQEAARADKLAAEADEARAAAEAAGAWSRSVQLLAIEAGRRWSVVVGLVLVVAGLVLIGSGAAWVRWSWGRSAVQALPGGLLSVASGGQDVIIDPARLVGGLVVVDRAGLPRPVLSVGEELAADVARAALVADAVKRVGGSESRAELAARVSESLSSAFANLAGAVAAPRQLPAVVPRVPALRLVPVRSAAEKRSSEAAHDAAELREFVEVGAAGGFQRSRWAGYKFKSTGRACSQTRWSILAGWLRESELIDGASLVVPADEALSRLGFQPESES